MLHDQMNLPVDNCRQIISSEFCNLNESGCPDNVSDVLDCLDLQFFLDSGNQVNELDAFQGMWEESAGNLRPGVGRRMGNSFEAMSDPMCEDELMNIVLNTREDQDMFSTLVCESRDDLALRCTDSDKESPEAGIASPSTLALARGVAWPNISSSGGPEFASTPGLIAAVEVSDQQQLQYSSSYGGADIAPPSGLIAAVGYFVEVTEQQQHVRPEEQHQPQQENTQRATAKRGKRALDAGAAVAPKRGKGNRGAHVRDRPDMQQAARDGAAHWNQRLRQVKAEWAAVADGPGGDAFRLRYQPQLDAAAGRVKAKLECLLRKLHLAEHQGDVVGTPAAPGHGFYGWGGFRVVAGRAREWRGTVEGLFPAGFKEETVRETFRRAGLVPAGWRWGEGWAGVAPFVPVLRGAAAGHASPADGGAAGSD
jgi:hypothetical protein